MVQSSPVIKMDVECCITSVREIPLDGMGVVANGVFKPKILGGTTSSILSYSSICKWMCEHTHIADSMINLNSISECVLLQLKTPTNL